jgi:threonine/homoserine/homoserine lactone efflux protein
MSYLLRGLAIGFSIAAPVGPIGVLCIRRTLSDGRAAGLACGLGAAVADAAYGCIAAFGLTLISDFFVGQRYWLQLGGGIFLCWLGIRTFVAAPSERAAQVGGRGLAAAFASTFVLTLTNPMTILSFAAVFAALGLGNASGRYGDAVVLVGGVFLGSAAWWLLLSAGVGLLGRRLDGGGLRWVNRVSGAVITGFGIGALATLLR